MFFNPSLTVRQFTTKEWSCQTALRMGAYVLGGGCFLAVPGNR
jgi:hypothetical protein